MRPKGQIIALQIAETGYYYAVAKSTYDYDVAVSFAGEDRHLVEPIVDALKTKGVQVFYDRHETANLWGTDGQAYFTDVFSKRARFCVMFVSRHYADKMWTNTERQAAMSRAMQQKTAYVLPVRMDDTALPGLLPTIQYLSYKQFGANGIVEQLLTKLDLSKGDESAKPPNQSAPSFNFQLPRLKKDFSQREKDVFARGSFDTIRQYFEAGLKQLEEHDPEVKTDFEAIHRAKFLCRIYVKGAKGSGCKIWLGGMGGRGSDSTICYHEGFDVSRDQDNSMSDMVSVTSDGNQLGFGKGMGFRSLTTNQDGLRTAEQVAEGFWRQLMARLKV